MLRLLWVLLLLVVGCAVHVEHDKIEHTGTVNHELSLDNVEHYFRVDCKKKNPDYTDAQVKDCADEKIIEFLDVLAQLVAKDGSK